jgi:hypothetical protein
MSLSACAVIHAETGDDTDAKFALNATDDVPALTKTVPGSVKAESLLYRYTGTRLCAVPLR